MTDEPCSVNGCNRLCSMFLCTQHQDQTRAILAAIPRMIVDLNVTRTRQSRVSSGQRGTRTKGDSEPLPYLPDRFGGSAAGDVVAGIRATLTLWATAIYSVRKDDAGAHRPPGEITAMCAWFADQVPFIAKWTEDDAAGFVDALLEIRRSYQHMVDRRPDRKFFGPCNTEVIAIGVDGNVLRPTGVTCMADLYGQETQAFVICTACRATHSMVERRDWLLKQAMDLILTADEIRAAFRDTKPDLARLLRKSTLRAWKTKGVLTDVGPGRYRVREVYGELDRIAARGVA